MLLKIVRKGHPQGFDATMNQIMRKQVEIGFFPEATYPEGTPVAYVAAIQEFGYPQGNIPARPFFRPTAESKRNEWGRQFAGAMSGALKGAIDFTSALEAIGGQAAGDVSRTISRITSPALKQSTIDARKSLTKSGNASSKPLVDTGHMLQSVTHKVSSK